MLVLLAGAATAEPTLRQSTCTTEVLTKLGAKCYEFSREENWEKRPASQDDSKFATDRASGAGARWCKCMPI